MDESWNRREDVPIRLQRVEDRLQDVRDDVLEIKSLLKGDYVSKSEFNNRVGLLERIVFTAIGFTLLAVLAAGLSWVIFSRPAP